jgi:hypothetical protein
MSKKGSKQSEEHKRKRSLAIKSLISKGVVIGMKGKKHSLETRKKMSEWQIGRKMSNEAKRKMSIAKKGKKLSEEHIKKLRECHRGEKSYLWRGGITKNPYPLDWTATLRRSIRERDNYICQLCSKLQGDELFDIHHINYDKNNCNPNNLITLCNSCHMKTNHNREYWIEYFLK